MDVGTERLEKLRVRLSGCAEELLALSIDGDPLDGMPTNLLRSLMRGAGIVSSVVLQIGDIILGAKSAGAARVHAAGEAATYLRALDPGPIKMRDLDLDAFADGVVAHRAGLGFHENPHGADALTVARLSWSMGWNERALAQG